MAGPSFVGRVADLRLLESALHDAEVGRPGVVVVSGRAGIGKTALVKRVLEGRPGTQTLWVTGYEVESMYALGVIDQIGRALGAEQLGPLRRSLDPLVLGAELLELLGDRAGRSTLAVVVDDAPWADELSLSAIGFALRRLVAEPVLAIFVGRDEDLAKLPTGLQRWLFAEAHGRVALGGLDEVDLIALAESLGRTALSPSAARRLWDHTEGNPLYAGSLLVELDSAVFSGPSPAPLPAPVSFSTLMLGRLSRLGGPAQDLVAGGAVLGTRFALAGAAALADLADPAGALDEAVKAGLLEAPVAPGGDICFAHPLIQAAIYHDLAPGRRAALHTAAAKRAGNPAAVLRHRAAACLGPDSGVADELAGFAAEQADQGSWATAAEAHLLASRLSPGSRTERWLLSGAECLVLAGDALAAMAMRNEIESLAASPLRDYVLGLIAWMGGDLAGGHRLYQRAWSTDTGTEPVLAAKIASQLAMVAVNEGRGHDAIDWATKALTANPHAADRGIARAVRALGFGETGRFAEGIADAGQPPAASGDFDAGALGALLGRGVLHMWAGQPSAAAADLGLAEEAARRIGPLYLRIIASYYLAEAEYRLGRWQQALLHAELAASLGSDAGGIRTSGLAHSVAAFPAAARGDWDRAEAHIAAAAEIIALLGDPANRLWLCMARARLAQARDDHEAVLAATEDVLALGIVDGREQPGIQPWALLRAEALVRSGGAEEAARLLDESEERIRGQQDNPSVRMEAARIRGLLAASTHSHDRAHAEFEQAEALAVEHESTALEAALVSLDYGAFLRRRGRRRAAGERLGAAQRALIALGAVPFLERCEAELRTLGVPTGRHGEDPQSLLTPQEQAVATLVATGLTNRQVAERLVISTKGVGYHLGNIFAKLGVRTRTELAARVARAESEARASG